MVPRTGNPECKVKVAWETSGGLGGDCLLGTSSILVPFDQSKKKNYESFMTVKNKYIIHCVKGTGTRRHVEMH